MENITSNIKILGYTGEIDDVSKTLKDIDKIKDQCCDVGVIQLLNAHAIGGRRHVLQGTIEAIKAFQRDENLANDLGIELCLRISAQRQISKALDILGLHTGKMDICIVLINCPDYFEDELNNMFTPNDEVFKPDIEYLSKIYNISDKQNDSIYIEDSLIDKTTSLIVDV
ncbi:MAG: KEOPS complex subunit Cgi121 [Methanobrevibacter wolinii]|nr:KEOPS complex subunit Cgi121 [Methanobrevibacter wolinii]